MGCWSGRGHYIHGKTICTPWVWYDILLILNWVWGPALWPMDHNCPVAYEPHLLRGLWTTTALWPMDHTCPVAYEPHPPRGLWTTTALWPMEHTCPVAHEPHLPRGLWTTTALWPMDQPALWPTNQNLSRFLVHKATETNTRTQVLDVVLAHFR